MWCKKISFGVCHLLPFSTFSFCSTLFPTPQSPPSLSPVVRLSSNSFPTTNSPLPPELRRLPFVIASISQQAFTFSIQTSKLVSALAFFRPVRILQSSAVRNCESDLPPCASRKKETKREHCVKEKACGIQQIAPSRTRRILWNWLVNVIFYSTPTPIDKEQTKGAPASIASVSQFTAPLDACFLQLPSVIIVSSNKRIEEID